MEGVTHSGNARTNYEEIEFSYHRKNFPLLPFSGEGFSGYSPSVLACFFTVEIMALHLYNSAQIYGIIPDTANFALQYCPSGHAIACILTKQDDENRRKGEGTMVALQTWGAMVCG